MQQPGSLPLLPRRPARRRRALGRALRCTCYAKLGFLVVLSLTLGLVYLRLASGPVRFDALREHVAQGIVDRLGAGWTVSLGDASLEMVGGALRLRTAGLDIRDPGGALVVRAPDAVVGVEPLSLIAGPLRTRSIEFRDLQLRALVNADGAISFVPEDEAGRGAEPPADASSEAPAGAGGRSALSAALASLFALLEPGGVAGAVDQASLVNARLTLFDAKRRERATFSGVNASLAEAGGERRFSLALQGADGPWRVEGALSGEGARRTGTFEAHAVSLRDLLLLAGHSNLPVTADLKLHAKATATLAEGRVEAFAVEADTGRGTLFLEDPDMPEVAVDALELRAAWDEGGRRFQVERAAYRAGGTEIGLAGTLALGDAEGGWVLDLAGRDAVLDGVGQGDAPVRLDNVALRAASRPGGIVLERAALQGPTLQVEGRGDWGTDPSEGLKLSLASQRIEVRSALRIWPPAVAAKARRYLVPHLRAGTAEGAALDVAMTVEDMRNAAAKRPIPEGAMRMRFRIADGVIAVAEGLPPLGPGAVEGTLTGTRLDLRAARARLALPGGRGLALPEASFVIPELGRPETVAEIGVHAQGGADALVALLQTPAVGEKAVADIDPASLRGRVDLRLGLRLSLDNVPGLDDLPVTVAGTLSDVGLDKPLGRERLEGANLALRYGDGLLTLKGEARLSGTPATIDLKQPKVGPGEAAVSLTLDEAARARRGLSFGAQLTGPVAVRALAPLGRPGAGTRVELDLARAAIDNLLPGWTKPAGRPGRASFVVGRGGGQGAGQGGSQGAGQAAQATELADIVVESGSVLIRGTAVIGADGGLDRANLSTLRLSTGDDMRAVVERAGALCRIQVRGNTADARPILKLLTAKPSGGSQGPAREIEVDFGANILTGFNGEAVTQASIRTTLRGREVRQLQFSGRLGSARVSGQTGRAERTPVLSVTSEDAGAVFRFLDVYKRMAGGSLEFQTTLGDGAQSGALMAREFRLRNEPALGQIIAEQPEARARAARFNEIDPGDVAFSRLKATFTRNSGRLDVREAVMYGPLVGFSVSGFIDTARDRTDIQGTFVPAYGLNNVFSQVPIVGPLLGGGQHEGLFAINFRLTGAASSPTLNVNPLSAIAPGFLRKVFGAITGDGPVSALPGQ